MSHVFTIHAIRLRTIDLVIVVALSILFVIVMYPYLTNGFWFDDSLNSQVWGLINRAETSLFDFSIKIMTSWLHAGRLMLSFPFIYSFYYYVNDPALVRFFDVVLVAVNIGLVVHLLRLLQSAWSMTGLFVLFLLMCFQVRDFHDPIGSYATFLQMLAIELILSLILLVKWLRGGSLWLVVLSSSIALFSAFCYELNVIYVPIAFLMIFFSSCQRKWPGILIVTVPFVIYVVVTLYIKDMAVVGYPGSQIGAMDKIPVTYLIQFASGLPGSYYFLRGEGDFSLLQAFALMKDHAAIMVVLFVLSFFCFWSFSERRRLSQNFPSLGIVFVALVLMCFPPLLISISSKYQSELIVGVGHIGVYYQYFGVALMMALGWFFVAQLSNVWLKGVVCLVFSSWLGFNFLVSLDRSEKLDFIFGEPRNSLVHAIESGLLDGVADGDTIDISGQPVFINGNLIYQVARKRVYIPSEPAIAGIFESKPREASKIYRLTRQVEAPRDWRIELVR
ncbi:hypothetical protein ACW9HW_08185 [Pseudomonas sp. SDO5532_S415]